MLGDGSSHSLFPSFVPHIFVRLQSSLTHFLTNPSTNNSSIYMMSAAANGTEKNIEIERKFLLTPTVKKKLLSFSSPTETICFRDLYYDEQLALNNIWLRKRNNAWEVKVPVQFNSGDVNSKFGATVYREITGMSQVREAVCHHYANLDIDIEKLECYAMLDTTRTQLSITWNTKTVHIILDECSSPNIDDFSCSIGELELMVHDESEVDDATQVLNDLVEHLQLGQVEDYEGKLIKYIKKYRPELFKKLIAKL